MWNVKDYIHVYNPFLNFFLKLENCNHTELKDYFYVVISKFDTFLRGFNCMY